MSREQKSLRSYIGYTCTLHRERNTSISPRERGGAKVQNGTKCCEQNVVVSVVVLCRGRARFRKVPLKLPYVQHMLHTMHRLCTAKHGRLRPADRRPPLRLPLILATCLGAKPEGGMGPWAPGGGCVSRGPGRGAPTQPRHGTFRLAGFWQDVLGTQSTPGTIVAQTQSTSTLRSKTVLKRSCVRGSLKGLFGLVGTCCSSTG